MEECKMENTIMKLDRNLKHIHQCLRYLELCKTENRELVKV